MKIEITLFIITLLFSSKTYTQVDFEKHIKSITENYYASEDKNGVFNANERAVEYALGCLMNNNVSEKYITNRKLLTKIEVLECKDASHIYFFKKLENNTLIDVKIKFKKFDRENHSIKEINNMNHIDGQIAFGSYYGTPTLEIDAFKIKINGKDVAIPKAVYSKFYDVFQCTNPNSFDHFYSHIEVYSSNDGKYVFIYLRGGHAANAYFAKLVFNREAYITEIIADYLTLREWNAFNNKNFIGF